MIRTRQARSPGLRERLKANTPPHRAADPDEIAQTAAWLLGALAAAAPRAPLPRQRLIESDTAPFNGWPRAYH